MSVLFDLLADFWGDIADWLIEKFTGKQRRRPPKKQPLQNRANKKTRYPRLLAWMPGVYFSLFQNFLLRFSHSFRPF